MLKYLEEMELDELAYGDLIRELEDWKSTYDEYEMADPIRMIETFEDMLVNA